MKKAKNSSSSNETRKIRPAVNPEARLNQMISLAESLAEQQLLDGTASSQIITHYLKQGSPKERLEREILEKQKDLIVAKTKAYQSDEEMKAMYKDAIAAFRTYSGNGEPDDE